MNLMPTKRMVKSAERLLLARELEHNTQAEIRKKTKKRVKKKCLKLLWTKKNEKTNRLLILPGSVAFKFQRS